VLAFDLSNRSYVLKRIEFKCDSNTRLLRVPNFAQNIFPILCLGIIMYIVKLFLSVGTVMSFYNILKSKPQASLQLHQSIRRRPIHSFLQRFGKINIFIQQIYLQN
jgi:hypothetical protein